VEYFANQAIRKGGNNMKQKILHRQKSSKI